MTLAPGPYYPGTPVRLTLALYDDDGNPVDPDAVTFKLMSPCGAVTSYVYGVDTQVQKASAGNYYADVTPDAGGRWPFRWETTGDSKTITKEGDILVQCSPFTDGVWDAYRA